MAVGRRNPTVCTLGEHAGRERGGRILAGAAAACALRSPVRVIVTVHELPK